MLGFCRVSDSGDSTIKSEHGKTQRGGGIGTVGERLEQASNACANICLFYLVHACKLIIRITKENKSFNTK